LLTSAYFLFYNTTSSFETQIAQTKTFHLPDDSEVLLNAASKITFNEKIIDKRTLKEKPQVKGQTFSKTQLMVLKVLGTHFNVKQRKNYFEVNLEVWLV
jgi:ferric-dicitrate binding protein FerR (iron transport regulator)